MHAAINTYTPEQLRAELNSQMFTYIYTLIPKIPKEQENRIVILKGKLVSFAYTEHEKQVLLNWKNNADDHLKGHDMTVGQKWSTVVKAFTMTTLSLEQKEAIFEGQRAEDPSDTAKNKRFTCDSLKAS